MSIKDNIAIKVTDVSKSFKLPHEKQTSIKGLLIGMFRTKKTYEKQEVLKDISFEVKKGEFFGIVGRNGSGKSTLLKILAGIYTSAEGLVEVNGRLTPFIELGVGFNPELTGRENVFLNGALLGFSRKEMEKKYDEIVSFAELERFMDQKLKNYSSGMQVRLAFSIAIQSEGDVYLFDEVLAVGDYTFQQKCYEYFKYLQSIKKTVIFVSHDVNALQMYCNKGILVEKGKIVEYGSIATVLEEYGKINANRLESEKTGGKLHAKVNAEDYGFLDLRKVSTFSDDKGAKKVFSPEEHINVTYTIIPKEDLDNPVFGLVILDAAAKPLFATNTMDMKVSTGKLSKGKQMTVTFRIKNVFVDGKYYISGAVASSDRTKVLYRFQNGCNFTSSGWLNTARGEVFLPHSITVND
ncbi:ABC transporter ATP-binding protein [Candidatus Saccharibacteria bacterium]|nr:ABC transporter ATP-binding protein [Candidatus Saccharibacteria bacterium]